MSKNYRRGTYKKSNTTHLMLVFLLAFLMGYLVASVFDLSNLIIWFEKHRFLAENKPKVIARSETTVPKFEFYTLLAKNTSSNKSIEYSSERESNLAIAKLPRKTLPVPGQNARLPADAVSPAPEVVKETMAKPEPTLEQGTYSLQLASFNKATDAEKLKAGLILKGFEVKIIPIRQNQLTWFRVMLGPFKSKATAEKVQLNLARNERIKGILHRGN